MSAKENKNFREWLDQIDLFTGSGIAPCIADMDEINQTLLDDHLDTKLPYNSMVRPAKRRKRRDQAHQTRRDTCRR